MQSYNATSRADHSRLSFFRLLVFVGAALALCAAPLAGETYPWQEQHATILPNGKLEWAPKPFVYEEGSTVYYIDYENGDDANSGTSTSAPWKHHPWDAEATGNADLAFGPATYVFKRGVIYRGNLYNGNDDIGSMYADSGTAAEPIRLTSDPNWGTGAAKFYGSVKLEGWVRADDPSIPTPARIPNPEKVWAVNLVDLGIMDADGKYIQDYRMPDQSPYPTNSYWPGYAEPWQYSLFRVNSPDDIERVWLSTNPNWEEGNPAYAMSYWPRMTGQSQLVLEEGTENETTIRGSILNTEAVGHPADYYAGGYAWMPWDSLMGTPQIREIPLEKTVTLPDEETEATYTVYDPATGTLNGVFPAAGAAPNLPYMIFNLPQFLDSAGEFYVDKTTGYLFYRPADGEDANDIHLEFSTCLGAIALESVSHIEITGLEFAFHLKDTIYVKPEDVTKTVTDIRIANCEFYHQLGTVLLFRSQASHDNYLPIDNIYITDNKFFDLANTAIHLEGYGGYAEVLRNKITNTGFWNIASQWSPLTALGVSHYDTMTVAGNIVESTWGSGIRANGGIKNYSGLDRGGIDYDRPLSRNYVYQNQTNDNARGVNDYGGLALWQGGPTYAWSNNIGSSVGHLPAGWRGTDPTNLSYPLYLDGAYKHYCFNNIVWGASDDPEDTYRNSTPGYFMVFGFLNQFANNTIYRQSRAVGGSSGARNEFVSNLGAEINDGGFFGTDGHVLNPSLEGGGDDGSLGVRGLPTLAYARNVAHTPTVNGMGTVKLADDENNLVTDIKAVDIETMISQMEANGIRYPYIGIQTDDPALPNFDGRLQSSADLEPRIAADSAAIDAGATYFVPFALSANVGEWHFIENHNDAAYITDYHFYMTKAMFNRKMYDKVPSHPLVVNSATLDDYVDVPREDWAKGGLYFDGTMYASLSDTVMREDIVLDYNENMNHKDDVGGDPWVIEITEYINDDEGNPVGYGTQTYPGDLRKTLCIKTSNILVEADIKVDAGTTGEILGKHDGSTGYRLFVNSANQFEFMVSAAGTDYSIATNAATAVNDGNWHHVIAEIDRATGVMSIYLNGNAVGTGGSNSTTVSLASDVSIDNSADYVVGANSSLSNNLSGVLDFMRVSQGTLADAQTTIDEVYAWQTDGPWTKDYFGNDPVGRRDAGAIEYTGYLNPPSNMVIAYNQPGQYVTVSWDDNSTSETGFRLERSTSPRFDENLMVANLDPDTTSYIDTTAVTGTTYYYRIYAVENGTDSPRSSVIKSAMSTATPAVPANVVFAIDETASTVAVDWDILDLSNTTNQPEKWKVKWSTTMGGPYTESSDLVYSDYTITGVDTSAPLYVVVDAINASDTTSTVEFIVFNDAMDFTGLADGALPSGWTASLDSTGEISTVSVATPTELVSPTGTPMIRYVDWSKDMFVTNDSSSDYSYYKVQATFANGGTNGYDSKGLTFAFLDTTNNAKLVINSSDDLKFSWDDISESITIIADDGEAAGDRVMDIGEFWTLSVSILPAEIVGLVDLHITLIDETGANRLPTSENAVNDDGVWILRNVTIPASGIAGKYGSYATVANGGTSVDKGIWFDSITVTPIGGTISEDVTASPLVHYDFDDNGGSTATDASGNGRDGSITGATWSGDTPDGSTSSLSFDGSGDLVEDADAADYLDGLDAYTVTVWVKSNSDTNNAGIYRLTTGSGDSKNHLRYDVAGWGGGGTKVLKAGFETTTTSVQGESADNAMSTDWQHIALSWSSGGEPKLYLDGQPFDWDTDANPFAPGTVDGVLSGVQTLLIGAGGQSETWDGWIDDFRIYDRALSASEVQAVFDAAGSGGGATVITEDDSDSVDEGGSKSVAVLDNDTNATQIDSFTQGSVGSVSQSGNELVYQPDLGVWSGTDSFDYTAGDGSTSDSATVNMTINATNGTTDPIGGDDFDQLLAFRNADGDIRERSDGSYEIAAFGGDGISTDGSGDQFLFAQKEVSGDFTVHARVKSIEGPSGSFAGVILRDGGDESANATLEKMALQASEKGAFYLSQERTNAGSGAVVAVRSQIDGSDVSHSEPEKWVMIERVGDEITYYTGEDDGSGNIGYTAIDAGPITLTGLSDTVQVGLFTISGDGTGNATAVFDNYTVTETPVETGPTPLVHYDFDDNGGATATDASGNGRDGSITGATWSGDTPDGSTSSLSFDGSDDLVEDADAADYLDGLDAYTVTVWVKSNSDTNNGGIYRLSTSSGDDKNQLRYDVAGWGGGGTKVIKAGFVTTTTSVQAESADNAMSTVWQHIALSWSSGGEPKLYLDGQPFDWDTDANPYAPGTVGGLLSGVQTLLIGAGGQSETWDGWIDDFRIYGEELTASQISDIQSVN